MDDAKLQKKLGKEMLAHKDDLPALPEYMKARLYFWTGQNKLAPESAKHTPLSVK